MKQVKFKRRLIQPDGEFKEVVEVGELVEGHGIRVRLANGDVIKRKRKDIVEEVMT